MQEQKSKKERNYWPHGIVASIILMIIACAYTVKFALDNPVEMDSYYLEKYQDVDENIVKIQAKQKAFFEKYDVVYEKSSKEVGRGFVIALNIIDKKSKMPVKDATVFLHVTRPETNKFNQEFNLANSDGTYSVKDVVVNKVGRWQLLTKIKVGTFEGFHQYEIFVNK